MRNESRPPARHRRQWPIKVTCQSVECARWQCSQGQPSNLVSYHGSIFAREDDNKSPGSIDRNLIPSSNYKEKIFLPVELAYKKCSTTARYEDKQAFGRKRKGVRQVIKAACFARSILFGSTSSGGEKIWGVTRGEYDSAAFAAFAGGLFTIRDSEIDRQLR